MLDKRAWVGRYADHVRRAVMLEPRGHADMCGALLTEPASPGSHAGILFMDNGGYRRCVVTASSPPRPSCSSAGC